MAVKKLAYYLIPLIVLILVVMWQFGPEGLFDGVKGAVEGIVDLAPKVTVGSEELKGEKPTIPPEHDTAIRNLVDTIKKMKDSEKTNCFANYGGLPALGEKGTSLNFQLEGDKTTLMIGGGAGGDQFVSDEDIAGFKPCVIAGESEGNKVSDNFYDTFLDSDSSEVKGKFYSSKNAISIAYDASWFNDENRINFGDGFRDFEDGAWLFKADNGNVCFFPTDGDGLDDKYVSGTGSNSISHRISTSDLKRCFAVTEEEKSEDELIREAAEKVLLKYLDTKISAVKPNYADFGITEEETFGDVIKRMKKVDGVVEQFKEGNGRWKTDIDGDFFVEATMVAVGSNLEDIYIYDGEDYQDHEQRILDFISSTAPVEVVLVKIKFPLKEGERTIELALKK